MTLLRLSRVVLFGTVVATGCGVTSICHAGRPSTVDDAGSNEVGKGHLEWWLAREEGRVNTINLSPAYGLLDGLEIGALLSRETTTGRTRSAAQFKWIVTPNEADGCNIGVSGGAARLTRPSERIKFANGLFTCNGQGVGSVHVNVGVQKEGDENALRTWGVAVERALGGVTPHLEVFGAQRAKSTVQVGLRGEVAKSLQLDGTIARVKGETTVSVGAKLQF